MGPHMLLRLWTFLALPSLGMLALILVLRDIATPTPWAIAIAVAAWTWLIILLWSQDGRRRAPAGRAGS